MMQQQTLPGVEALRRIAHRSIVEGGRRGGHGQQGSIRSLLYFCSALGTMDELAFPPHVLRRARRLELVQTEMGGMIRLTKLGTALAKVLEYV